MLKPFYKTLLPIFVAALFFGVTVLPAKAATMDELQAQISALLAQIARLQGTGGSAPSTSPGSAPSETRCQALNTYLQIGATDAATGGQVTRVQEFLVSHYGLNRADYVTGYFGPGTQELVRRFQRENGLSPEGTVGPLTRTKIAERCGGSSTSSAFQGLGGVKKSYAIGEVVDVTAIVQKVLQGMPTDAKLCAKLKRNFDGKIFTPPQGGCTTLTNGSAQRVQITVQSSELDRVLTPGAYTLEADVVSKTGTTLAKGATGITITSGTGASSGRLFKEIVGLKRSYAMGEMLDVTAMLENIPAGMILCVDLKRELDGKVFNLPGNRCTGVDTGTSNHRISGPLTNEIEDTFTPGEYMLEVELKAGPKHQKEGTSFAEIGLGFTVTHGKGFPPSCVITADKTSVKEGEEFTLRWETFGMSKVVMHQDLARGEFKVQTTKKGTQRWVEQPGQGSFTDSFRLSGGTWDKPTEVLCATAVDVNGGTATKEDVDVGLELVAATAKSQKGGTEGVFTIKFDVKASGDDIFVPANAKSVTEGDEAGVGFYVLDAQRDAVDTGVFSATLTSSAAQEDRGYKVADGESEHFVLTVKFTPAISQLYSLKLEKLNFFKSNGIRVQDGGEYDKADFVTNSVSLRSGSGSIDNALTVTAPNGGEEWELGTTESVTWKPYGYNPNVNPSNDVVAYLEQKNPRGDGFSVLGKIQESGKASIHWVVGDMNAASGPVRTVPPGEYYVRVVNTKTKAWDRSDAPFVIEKAPLALTVNGSAKAITIADRTKVLEVAWDANNSLKTCQLSGIEGVAFSTVQPNKGLVRGKLASNEGYIKMECDRKGTKFTRYVPVIVKGQTSGKAFFKVISPNGGEKIDPTKKMDITFESSGIVSYSAALYKNDQWKYWITKDYPVYSTQGDISDVLSWTPSSGMQGLGEGDNAGAIFKIYITGKKADGSGYVDDKSDAAFSFSTTQSSVTKTKTCAANFSLAPSRVWGTGVYTSDSDICTAAVHAGMITRVGGGIVTYEVRAGQPSYTGGLLNGVQSQNWGQWKQSITFISSTPLPASSATTTPAVTSKTKTCAPNFVPNAAKLWGTDTYTTDSDICTAALHAEVVTRAGGAVTYEIRPGQTSYTGTSRNGVSSQSWGQWKNSFVFTSPKVAPLPAPTGSISATACVVGAAPSTFHPTNANVCDSSFSWSTNNAVNAYVVISGTRTYSKVNYAHGFSTNAGAGLSKENVLFWTYPGTYTLTLYADGKRPTASAPGTGVKLAETTITVLPKTTTTPGTSEGGADAGGAGGESTGGDSGGGSEGGGGEGSGAMNTKTNLSQMASVLQALQDLLKSFR